MCWEREKRVKHCPSAAVINPVSLCDGQSDMVFLAQRVCAMLLCGARVGAVVCAHTADVGCKHAEMQARTHAHAQGRVQSVTAERDTRIRNKTCVLDAPHARSRPSRVAQTHALPKRTLMRKPYCHDHVQRESKTAHTYTHTFCCTWTATSRPHARVCKQASWCPRCP